MKKTFNFLAILMLASCIVSFAFDQIAPANPVNALSESPLVLSEAGASQKAGIPIRLPAEPVVFVMVGITCVLFGVAAVSPLIVEVEGR